jgi:hypothetical protein
LLLDFKESAGEQVRREIFHGESNGVGGVREAPISERLTPRQPFSRRKQFSRGLIVKLAHRTDPHFVPKRLRAVNWALYTRNRLHFERDVPWNRFRPLKLLRTNDIIRYAVIT